MCKRASGLHKSGEMRARPTERRETRQISGAELPAEICQLGRRIDQESAPTRYVSLHENAIPSPLTSVFAPSPSGLTRPIGTGAAGPFACAGRVRVIEDSRFGALRMRGGKDVGSGEARVMEACGHHPDSDSRARWAGLSDDLPLRVTQQARACVDADGGEADGRGCDCEQEGVVGAYNTEVVWMGAREDGDGDVRASERRGDTGSRTRRLIRGNERPANVSLHENVIASPFAFALPSGVEGGARTSSSGVGAAEDESNGATEDKSSISTSDSDVDVDSPNTRPTRTGGEEAEYAGRGGHMHQGKPPQEFCDILP
ncbi:hypothetical protein FB451DRAFT_1190208 [Mycena latifolia]|nr:hypothetical protein FB451DRAFT_1190208 [Mycena latifolia]